MEKNLFKNVPGSNGNEKVLHIPQSYMTEASPLDCSPSYSTDWIASIWFGLIWFDFMIYQPL